MTETLGPPYRIGGSAGRQLSGTIRLASGDRLFIGETVLYRSALSTLKTDGALVVGGALTAGATTVTALGTGTITMTDNTNIVLGETNGTVIGTTTAQKLGFLGAAAVTKPAATQSPRQALTTFGLMSASGQLSEPTSATVATSETTTSTSYTDLATTGPAVTVTTGTKALVIVGSTMSNSQQATNFTGFAVSGATTVAATDTKAFRVGLSAGLNVGGAAVFLVTGLTAGSNTFTAKYRTDGGTVTVVNRDLTVMPL